MNVNIPLLDEIAAESRRLLREVSETNDRAAAITAAAVVDDLLHLLLRGSMLKDDKTVGELLDVDSFTFSIRIDLCYSFGLISELERRDLHIVRKIRNDFAHSWTPVSFDDPGTRDRCRSLNLAQRFWSLAKVNPTNTKTWFLTGWVVLANHLSLRLNGSRHTNIAAELGTDVPIVFGGGSAPGAALVE